MEEVMGEITDEIDEIEWNDNWGECPNTIHEVHHFIKVNEICTSFNADSWPSLYCL
ncbi:MAG: hypothetical protein ACLT8H_09865 [Streptococcus parasanguinis]